MALWHHVVFLSLGRRNCPMFLLNIYLSDLRLIAVISSGRRQLPDRRLRAEVPLWQMVGIGWRRRCHWADFAWNFSQEQREKYVYYLFTHSILFFCYAPTSVARGHYTMTDSVCLSVLPFVRLSVCLSVCPLWDIGWRVSSTSCSHWKLSSYFSPGD